MPASLVVYLGPSIEKDVAARLLPGALLRPPITRGDLYEDRIKGGSLFVIIDGQFAHRSAISVREVVEVAEDGALVVGAASLGALRAAECWPCGVRGVGTIYRLVRSGVLGSDDEVAVAFSAEDPSRGSTPLVNFRYALWKAMRTGIVSRSECAAIVEAAQSTYFAERSWRVVLRAASVSHLEPTLTRLAAEHDLKRLDAQRALTRVRRWCQVDARLLERPGKLKFRWIEHVREPQWRAAWTDETQRSAFCEWMNSSGRVRRYNGYDSSEPEPNSEELCDALSRIDELDAEQLRWKAHLLALSCAVGQDAPTQAHYHQSEVRLAIEHGYATWLECEDAHRTSDSWAAMTRLRDELARVALIRQTWFRR